MIHDGITRAQKATADATRDVWEGSLPVTPSDMRLLHDAIAKFDSQMLGPSFGKFTLVPNEFEIIARVTGLTVDELHARGIICVPE